MDPVPAVTTARPDEWSDALRLLFRDLAPEERERRIVSALGLLRTGELDPAGLFVEHNAGGVAGVLVCLPVQGASALFWPPRSVVDSDATAREDRLVTHALGWVRSRGAKLAQGLLTADESLMAGPLLRNGFCRVTRLWYLCHDNAVPVLQLSTPARLEFRSYDPARPSEFHRTLLQTYEGTRDCPEINGIRTVDEVIAGHRAQGRFDPTRWWLALEADRPVGVLLLTEMPESGDWDVSYLGIVSGARRRGLGRELVLKALAEAKAGPAARVTLSVDGRNEPALHLYRSFGFVPFDRREVLLAIRQ
jgi:ribosomal protein S18 acetylase RimI-like enzyme